MENLSIFLKILILGESNVGKTSILTRFLTGNYDPDLEPSLGTDYHIKLFKEYATKLKIQFWDINGSKTKKIEIIKILLIFSILYVF